MKTLRIEKKEILKIVYNSQKIEGYKPVSKSLIKKAKDLMVKYNVKVLA